MPARVASRLDFERILTSNDTVQVLGGRDEESLGRTRSSTGPSRGWDPSASTSSPPPVPPLPTDRDTDRGVYGRSAGAFASTPNVTSTSRSGGGGTQQADRTDVSDDESEEAVEVLSGGANGSRGTVTRRDSETPSTVNASTSTPPRKSRGNLSIGTADSIISISSYVHVSSVLPEDAVNNGGSPALPARRRASAATLGRFSPRKLQQAQQFDLDALSKGSKAGSASTKAEGDDASKASFSSTMRSKTSRFFKKLGGGSSKDSSSSSVTLSLNSNSSAVAVNDIPSAPPVPPIPALYSNPTKPRTSSVGRDRVLSTPPPHPSNASINLVAPTPLNNTDSKATIPAPLPSPSNGPQPPRAGGRHTRQRSLSLDSLTAARLLAASVASGSKLSSPSSPTRRTSTGQARLSTEDEKLTNELQTWKFDIDNVLGAIGDGEGLTLWPNGTGLPSKQSLSAPPSPMIMLPKFSPLGMVFPNPDPTTARLSISGAPIRSRSEGGVGSGPPSFSKDGNFVEAKPVVTPVPILALRSQSLPTAVPSYKMPPPPSSPLSSDTGRAQVAANSLDPPSIRLVSPPPSTSDHDNDYGTETVDQEINPKANPTSFNQSSSPSTVVDGVSEDSVRDIGSDSPASTLTHRPRTSTPTQPSSIPSPPSTPIPTTTITTSSSTSLKDPFPLPILSAPPPTRPIRQSVVGFPLPSPLTTSLSRTSLSNTEPGSGSGSMSGSRSRASLQSNEIPSRRTSLRAGIGIGGESGEGGSGDTGTGMGEERKIQERGREFAKRCWEEDVTFLEPKKIAEWLGSRSRLNVVALRFYIEMFDFTGLRLDVAFRRLCEKLYLKAETQQVDRILVQFSKRYWENNPKSVYGSADVVHAVSYSLLLLNTDLHVADMKTNLRMTRSQFVENTMSAIRAQLEDSGPIDTGLLFGSTTATEEIDSSNVFVVGSVGEASKSHKSLDRVRGDEGVSSVIRPKRSGSLQSERSLRSLDPSSTSLTNLSVSSGIGNGNGNGTGNGNVIPSPVALSKGTTKSPSFDLSPVRKLAKRSVSNDTVSSGRMWDADLELTLREIYSAIKVQPIFQPSVDRVSGSLLEARSTSSLLPGGSPYGTWSGGMTRSGSRSVSSTLGSGSSSAFKRASVRGFGSFLGASSLELARSSSPTTSTSSFSDDLNLSRSFHQIPTIGFANSLSNTIIREQQEEDTKSEGDVTISDEELALLGAPWAKEGIIYRKHYWESTGKRAKDKNWLQVFVVISQGEMRMFRFDGAGTIKGKGSAGVGGGDWASNAQGVGEVSLVHALCSAMPAPGYSHSRPHCFVLTLPTGGSYFFQTGTRDLIAEWVATCNYWAARLSKEPLSGGVSNMEYGWNRVADREVESIVEDPTEVGSIRSGKSGRSSFSRAGPPLSAGLGSLASLYDRIHINDWKPPNVPEGSSSLSEEAQLESLTRHVEIIRSELALHNALRSPMSTLFSSRSLNLAKATANWERKSQHLLSELIKFTTYIEALSNALQLRALKLSQKEIDLMLLAADDPEALDNGLSSATSGTTISQAAQVGLGGGGVVGEEEGGEIKAVGREGEKEEEEETVQEEDKVDEGEVPLSAGLSEDEFFDSVPTPTRSQSLKLEGDES